MFSFIEVVLLLAIAILAVLAWKAHHDHKTLKQEAADDLAKVESAAKADIAELKTKVSALEAKALAFLPVSAPTVPVITYSNPSGGSTSGGVINATPGSVVTTSS